MRRTGFGQLVVRRIPDLPEFGTAATEVKMAGWFTGRD
ncbi:hypothetical protein Rhow_008427 [Rhodococcus wratislaviensis]|uniref:Uncharacterized protein n=1 Tax=Rhodococcus wratislaviensis TaxID=44752 RepID=A0A402CKQ9_RHOWR|nr:hypothetical protein Rhow_008427 [Rhodococcus wratislaviensis]